jgi:endonuclease/exonuclease/phosphatase family metal-dependent hydrolase
MGRRPIGLLALLVGGACIHPARPSGQDAELLVLVYNIHAGKDTHGVDNLAGVAAIVRETRADIVLLQEVDRGTKRSGGVDQVDVLRRATGYHAAFGRTLDYDGGQYGIAMLSRWPLEHDTLIHLPVEPPQERSGGSHEPRGAMRASVNTPLGPLVVLNTHIDASREDTYRAQEARTIRSLVQSALDGGATVLAGGDFNSEPASAVQDSLRRTMRDAWRECGTGDGLSYPDDKPVKRIDYLFLTRSMHCAGAEVLDTRVSDHRPVLFRVVRR